MHTKENRFLFFCFMVYVCGWRGVYAVPSPARDVAVDAPHLGELHITWQPPIKPNGLVTHYVVYWQRQLFQPEKYHQRNYCDNSTFRRNAPHFLFLATSRSRSGCTDTPKLFFLIVVLGLVT